MCHFFLCVFLCEPFRENVALGFGDPFQGLQGVVEANEASYFLWGPFQALELVVRAIEVPSHFLWGPFKALDLVVSAIEASSYFSWGPFEAQESVIEAIKVPSHFLWGPLEALQLDAVAIEVSPHFLWGPYKVAPFAGPPHVAFGVGGVG